MTSVSFGGRADPRFKAHTENRLRQLDQGNCQAKTDPAFSSIISLKFERIAMQYLTCAAALERCQSKKYLPWLPRSYLRRT